MIGLDDTLEKPAEPLPTGKRFDLEPAEYRRA